MNMTPAEAHVEALNIVKTALQSGAIKLGGPSGGASPSSAGLNDALYLITLAERLTTSFTKKN